MVDQLILDKAQQWLGHDFDQQTREQVQYLIEKDPDELAESFYRELEFGTGGLRGIMGVGTNRMNKYTVGMATQGLANYLKKSFPGQEIKLAIAHDSRNNSRFFALIAANILSANGLTVYLFDDLRPTPMLSFAIRHLQCQSGIVLTASHNPKEYNGYKVYWDDGGQLVAPHDNNVMREIEQIKSVAEVQFAGNQERIIEIGEEIDAAYVKTLLSLSLAQQQWASFKNIRIVYSALHGTGAFIIPRCLEAFGFPNVSLVEKQMEPDGNFPTVQSPNPEEKEAMAMSLALAREVDADLIMATDPDGDRVGIGVKDGHGRFILLNGNQAATVLVYYLLEQYKTLGRLNGKQFIAKTIVTSDLLKKIAINYGVASFDVLTGFKYIAALIRSLEGEMQFLGGGEESYGYLVGDYVRDKDAVIACCMIAEATAWAASRQKSLFDLLLDIYHEYGFFKETLVSITRKGKAGADEIAAMMERFRNQPPKQLNNIPVLLVKDYQSRLSRNLIKGETENIDLPKSNVIQFYLEDGSRITVRPSGTEPKIKFYFGVVGELPDTARFAEVDLALQNRINAIILELGL